MGQGGGQVDIAPVVHVGIESDAAGLGGAARGAKGRGERRLGELGPGRAFLGLGEPAAAIAQRIQLHVAQGVEEEPARLTVRRAGVAVGRGRFVAQVGIAHPPRAAATGGKEPVGRFVIQGGEAPLLEVVEALDPPGRLSRRLDGRQQQGDEDADDRDHDQQFDEGEPARFCRGHRILLGTDDRRRCRDEAAAVARASDLVVACE